MHYDSLLAENRVEEYRKQEGKRHGLGLLSVGVSSLAGGFLYTLNPELPILMTMMASGMMMFVMAMLMIEPERHQSVCHANPFRAMADGLLRRRAESLVARALRHVAQAVGRDPQGRTPGTARRRFCQSPRRG